MKLIHLCFLETDCAVVTVDCPLAPEHPYPAATNDAFEALDWVCGSGAQRLNLDLDCVGVGGTLAGSNLAVALCLKAVQDLSIRIRF